MTIRKAGIKDIPIIFNLLKQVLKVHSDIRPDIFVPETTKYTEEQLSKIINDVQKPVFVAERDNEVLGYVFCVIKEQEKSDNLVQFKSVYIDDLCVDVNHRGEGIGTQLFDYVKKFAKDLGCYEITLNVWEGNNQAQNFYKDAGMRIQKTCMEFII